MTTLINTPQCVIAVVEQAPKIGDWAYNTITNSVWLNDFNETYLYAEHTIIASTFGIGKKLTLSYDGAIILEPKQAMFFEKYITDFTKPYEYTETENSIVIKL